MSGGSPISKQLSRGAWGQASLVFLCLGVVISTTDLQGGSLWHGFQTSSLLCLVLSLALSRGLSVARSHLLLREFKLSVHPLATARLGFAELALNSLPRILARSGDGPEGLYSRWFGGGSPSSLQVRTLDALLAGDWPGWISGRFCEGTSSAYASKSPLTPEVWTITFLQHVTSCAALFFALKVAGGSPESWLRMLWILPLARLAGGWTFRFGGLGPRELLLSLLLVPGDTATGVILRTGGLLSLFHLAEVAIGLRFLWHRSTRSPGIHQKSSLQTISVIIPVLNEIAILEETVRRVRRVPEVCEIIVVDGGSQDGTQSLAMSLGCLVLACAPGRGGQLRLGAQRATGDVTWLLHADTWVEPDAGQVMLRCLQDPGVVAGGFWKRFRETRWLLLGSRVKCAIRVWAGRRIVGDMAMFVRSDALREIGGVPDMELMEDFELSRRLRRIGRLALADGVVTTSARRFIQKGVLCTYLKMWQITTLYLLGHSPAELRRRYG